MNETEGRTMTPTFERKIPVGDVTLESRRDSGGPTVSSITEEGEDIVVQEYVDVVRVLVQLYYIIG